VYITLVYVEVKQGHIDDFQQACKLNHEASIKEPGNVRFDILQSSEAPHQFVLYEAYASKAAAAAHKDTPHYLRWRETVADWMAAPRKGVSYTGLYPEIPQ